MSSKAFPGATAEVDFFRRGDAGQIPRSRAGRVDFNPLWMTWNSKPCHEMLGRHQEQLAFDHIAPAGPSSMAPTMAAEMIEPTPW
jgi:hypothetical protein